MPNNKEYQDAYNKMYYQANKEFLNWKRSCYKRTYKPKPKKERPLPIIEIPEIPPPEIKEREAIVGIKEGNFLIEW